MSEKNPKSAEQSSGTKNIQWANSAYLPVPIAEVASDCLSGLSLHLRDARSGSFILYRFKEVEFTEPERQRLVNQGTQYVYLNMSDHRQYKKHLDKWLTAQVTNESIAIRQRARILMNTSIELANTILTEPSGAAKVETAGAVASNIVRLAMSNAQSFNHLLAIASHDYYTATHSVNVSSSIVPFAQLVGITEEEDLCKLAGAALLHDIGKMELDEELLNKPKSLSEEQKERIQQHPEVGLQMIADADMDEASRAVISQHHERMDGTGYPNGLKGDEIHEWARLCAIVDSFDAMISQVPSRPAVSVVEALHRLEDGAGALYDETMTGEFVALVRERGDDDALADSSDNRRRHERRNVSVEALAQVIDQENPASSPPPFSINTVDMSRSGICFAHSEKVEPGNVVRIWIETGNGRRTLDAMIVRCSPSKGGFTYGARFDFHFDADGNPTAPIISTERSTEEPLDTESAEPAGEEAGAAEANAQPADLEDSAPAEEVASNE